MAKVKNKKITIDDDIKEKVGNIAKLILQQHSFQIKELENKVKYIEEMLTIDK